MQNIIQREITIEASEQRIYEAIANSEQLTLWFPESVEGSYSVGEQPIFGFGPHGKNRVYIVAAQPHEYFAYRWVPGAHDVVEDVLKVPNTLVEFRISKQPDGQCKVTLTESGFAELPAESMEDAYRQNSGGWDCMLERLEELFKAR